MCWGNKGIRSGIWFGEVGIDGFRDFVYDEVNDNISVKVTAK